MAAQTRTGTWASDAPKSFSVAEATLNARVTQLGSQFAGDVGIAVEDIQTGYVTHFDGNTLFPQQSVSKLWVALTALELAEHGHLDLDAPVRLTMRDLTLFHQPIAGQIMAHGHATSTLRELIRRAMQQSDNTCNDFVLRAVGGPEKVRNFMVRHRIQTVRFGPGERIMQSELAGLDWRPAYSLGRSFYEARNRVPLERRRAAFARYIADPVDGATPLGMVGALARLKRGELLTPGSADNLLSIMANTKTGPLRLKGGIALGWRLAHKTGTGQQLKAFQTGYNDVGIITSPAGRSYAAAVMIRKTAAPVSARMALMQNVSRAIVELDQNITARDRSTARQ